MFGYFLDTTRWIECKTPLKPREISGFHREVDDNCTLLGCYAACSGNSSPTFLDNLLGHIFMGQESKKYPTSLDSSRILDT